VTDTGSDHSALISHKSFQCCGRKSPVVATINNDHLHNTICSLPNMDQTKKCPKGWFSSTETLLDLN